MHVARLLIGCVGWLRDHHGGCHSHVASGPLKLPTNYTVSQGHEADEQKPDEGATDKNEAVEHGGALMTLAP
jgi:hypothetical protein